MHADTKQYDVQPLKQKVTTTFRDRIKDIRDPEDIMSIANWIYDDTPDGDAAIREEISMYVQGNLSAIMATFRSRGALMNNSGPLEDLLNRFAVTVD
ncbi:hypothetical protein M501DRAFT_997718, partial [Patellaria atrata CBS 101060]